MRSAEELNDKLTASERQCNKLFDRVQMLEYNLSEIFGTAEEFTDMPCSSLQVRMMEAIARAEQRVLKQDKKG